MLQDINKIRDEIKKNVNLLVSNGNTEQAKILISEYSKIVSEDVEVYSMNAVIAIMEENLETAEEIINQGLELEENNFDLLFNLAYVYEKKGEYCKALIYYKRARKLKYYDSVIKIEIDSIIENIYKNHKDSLEKEQNTNEIYKFLNKINNVLFIDFNLTSEVNNLGKSLDEYGINVDLAYRGIRPDMKFSNKDLSYRKLLGITNIDDLIEYINHYNYDIVHVFDIPDNIRLYISSRCKSCVVFDNGLLISEIDKVISYYGLNKKSYYKKTNENINNEKLTILIPTYNRTKYLERVLKYFNNFKYFKPNIFVLDSSFEENKIVNENIVKSFDNEKIKYYHFESSISFFKKMNWGVQQVTTSFLAVCPDDDFLTEEGLIESVNILNQKKDLYSIKGKNLYFIESMANLIEYDFFQGLYEENSIDRLQSITKGFVPTVMYQVFKSGIYKNMYDFWQKNVNNLPKNNTFQEYLFYFMIFVTGKIGKINVDLNIRDKSIPRAFETFKNFPHAILDESFNDDYKKFSMFLRRYMEAIGRGSDQFNKKILEIFSDFLTNFLNVPRENIVISNNEFNLEELEIGMRKSWVWPNGL